MSHLIAIRLLPDKPVSASDFTQSLNDLTITAIELSFDNLAGDEIGSAAYLPLPDSDEPQNPDSDTRITQHFATEPDEFGVVGQVLTSVATAVIVVESAQAQDPEYGTYDIKLRIERSGNPIFNQQIFYNVPVVSGNASNPRNFQNFATSLHLTLPPSGQQLNSDTQAYVNFPEDGSPPNFIELYEAIDDVLDEEPDDETIIGELTPTQCRHIAREIIWNRDLFPLPDRPTHTSPSSSITIEDLYTEPHDGVEDSTEQERLKFEAELQVYYALHNAEAQRLEGYVCAVSAAVYAEDVSTHVNQVGFKVPTLIEDNSQGKIKQMEVVLTASAGPLNPGFRVPAEAFYALGAVLPVDTPRDLLYKMAVLQEPQRIQQMLRRAIDTGVVIATQDSNDDPQRIGDLTLPQIVRRLKALGAVEGIAYFCELESNSPEQALVQAWLIFEEDDIVDFWSDELANHAQGHLDLLLCAVTQNHQPLSDAITGNGPDELGISNFNDLTSLSHSEWQRFFLPLNSEEVIEPRLDLLPAFTLPGTPEQRVEAFIRYLQRFFDISLSVESPEAPEDIEGAPLLRISPEDPIQRFIDKYQDTISNNGDPFDFGTEFSEIHFTQAIGETFPDDNAAQAWLDQALRTIHGLWRLVQFGPEEMRFSLVEALYSRGFTSPEVILEYDSDGFQEALTGTVAFEPAETIYENAQANIGDSQSNGSSTDNDNATIFRPLNHNGCLVNCIPPPHLSPLGPIAYLHEMLQISEESTCDEPFPQLGTSVLIEGTPSGGSISHRINERCGSPALLLVTRANLETLLLNIDLVNECLEAAITSLPALPVGHVHNTNGDELGGHDLCPLGPHAEPVDDTDAFCHVPETLFEALPEHSTPASPVVPLFSVGLEFQADLEQGMLSNVFRLEFSNHGTQLSGNATITTDVEGSRWRINDPDAHQTFIIIREGGTLNIYRLGPYEILARDFSHCILPYSQPLDINRTYLKQLGTSRYETMRTFREATSEFVLDPENPPTEFESNRWREPVSELIAAEYLGISPQVHELLFERDIATSLPADANQLILWEMYGFPTEEIDGESWLEIVVQLQEFLKRTCLSYCQFIELWQSEFVTFHRSAQNPEDQNFSECEPCELDEGIIVFDDPSDSVEALRRLIVFIRLWRILQNVPGAQYSFVILRDICVELGLFNDNGSINPDFIRQLSAFQRTRDLLVLPLFDEDNPPLATQTNAERTHLLSLINRPEPLVPTDPNSIRFLWVLDQVLDQLQPYAYTAYKCPRKPPHFLKLLAENMDALSRLAGFDPDNPSDTWHAQWTHILRMIEVLGKIYASNFSVGQILYLFTSDEHLHGDDPFPQQPPNEALCRPFDLPDDLPEFSLWTLRDKLLAAEVSEEDASAFTWSQIVSILQDEFGYAVPDGETDHLHSFGQHFIPGILEVEGVPVGLNEQQYRTSLPQPPLPAPQFSPAMWNTPQDGPFRYDITAEELWTDLPLTDEAVLWKLSRVRPLQFAEQAAVRAVYFAPRVDLCSLGFLFPNMSKADMALIQEPDEQKRWGYFRNAFAIFYARCKIIASHFAEHVATLTNRPNKEGFDLAWQVLRHLRADENFATTPWEVDSGEVPEFTWEPQPHCGAFAALLGLVGTGLLGTYRRRVDGLITWQDMRSPIGAFGEAKNAMNAPVPTLIPSMSLVLNEEQQRFLGIRNGFAMDPATGKVLGGVEEYIYTLRGLLLVEDAGDYKFSFEAEHPEAKKFFRWFVRLQQGQKVWSALVNDWPDEEGPADCSAPLPLRRGVYDIEINIHRLPLIPDGPEDVCPQLTGFGVKYMGPDTGGEWLVPPHKRLFLDYKDGPLEQQEITAPDPTLHAALSSCCPPTVRNIRRTANRIHKTLLCAHNHTISAKLVTDSGQSEFDFFPGKPQEFQGVSYFRDNGGFSKHHVNYDFNFLPVLDNYYPPEPNQDQRAQPSVRRMQALFDVFFEALFDYTRVREEAAPAREAPAVKALHELAESHTDRINHFLRNLGVHLFHKDLVLRYFEGLDLTDDNNDLALVSFHWLYRVWQAEKWIRKLKAHFLPKDIRNLRPDLVAETDPAVEGNANLTAFYRDGCIENGEPRRYPETEGLNNELRIRGRQALLAYLKTLNRVVLPWGGFADTAKDLSELFLIDVEAGVCQKASRVEEAISSVHLFIQRARLGLEPNFAISNELILLWDRLFATYEVWLACKRRELYPENWIDWKELQQARRSEGFLFLESELRRATLTVPVPGGLEHWPNQRPPLHPGIAALQKREPAGITRLESPIPEGLDLMGTPERHARPSWLASLSGAAIRQSPDLLNNSKRLPFWVQAAIRLGARFIRVAAAGEPPASTAFETSIPDRDIDCCVECGQPHPALVDEYYFWLVDSRYFSDSDIAQNADWGIGVSEDNAVSDWHRQERLPGLLHWQSEPMVHLFWCRVHNGEFKQTRRSFEGVRVNDEGTIPQLEFLGRSGDSLNFRVLGGQTPDGFSSPPDPGFRFDIVSNLTVVVPNFPDFVNPDEPDENPQPPDAPEPPQFPGGLPVYPYFAYHAPGAPLVPSTLFSPALAVAEKLRSHCRFEATLKWYECFFNPLQEDLSEIWCDAEVPAIPIQEPQENSEELFRQRSIILHYVETLLSWGDALMRSHSPESFQQARLIFDTAERIFGEKPRSVLAVDALDEPHPIAQFDSVSHDPPLNPNLLALYNLLDDRQPIIHACLNTYRLRNGRVNKHMPYWGNSLAKNDWDSFLQKCHDPNNQTAPCLDEADWCCPKSPYRFTFLVQKAQELASDVRGLGAALLAAYEKGDAEFLASLRASHERQLLNLTQEIRQNQWREADWQVQALQKTKEIAQTRFSHINGLIENGLIKDEQQYQTLTNVALGFNTAGTILEGISQVMNLIPDITIGAAGIASSPVNINELPLGTKLAFMFAGGARISNLTAQINNTTASLRLTQGGWGRREDEWYHQAEVLGIEIEQIERQILAAERRKDIALRELDINQRQIEQSSEIHDYLHDKFTSHELYLWLQKETAALHYRMYELALHSVRQAERAYNFERGFTSKVFIDTEIWDNLHEGLLAGERLQLALRQMEKSYLDCNIREYELTKHFSLRCCFPEAFLLLRTTGYCEIEIPEWMFDRDYPGHYLRRIKNVTLTLPAVVGPFTGVHCRLTLLKSDTRVTPVLIDPPAGCCNHARPINSYAALPEDLRIVKQYAATEAIATSGGQNDAGMFEVSFGDARYLPFEYRGAISCWRIELPPENNQFDLGSLGDLMLHLNYTAREGGELLRKAANETAQLNLPGDGLQFLDVKRESPNEWHRFVTTLGNDDGPGKLNLQLNRKMFPYLFGNKKLYIKRVTIFFEAPDADPSAHHNVELWVDEEGKPIRDESRKCDVHTIHCIATKSLPGLFHGVLDIELGPISENDKVDLGTLRFAHEINEVSEIFLIFAYMTK